jgi:hypothetical protein
VKGKVNENENARDFSRSRIMTTTLLEIGLFLVLLADVGLIYINRRLIDANRRLMRLLDGIDPETENTK